MKKVWFWGILVAFSVSVVLVWKGREDKIQDIDSKTKIIAHRGDTMNAPENTLAAMEQAVSSGADMMEIDLRITKDGVPVVFHDEMLLRITGINRAICEMNSWEIKRLDAGKWFLPGFSGERIPMLNELLKMAKGRIALMIELKDVPDAEMLLKKTIAEIRKMNMERECVLASVSLDILSRGEELAPELNKIYIGEKLDAGLWEVPYVDGYSIRTSEVSEADVKKAHQLGRKLYVWTVNDPWSIRRTVSMGVDGVVTDAPQLAKKILNAL